VGLESNHESEGLGSKDLGLKDLRLKDLGLKDLNLKLKDSMLQGRCNVPRNYPSRLQVIVIALQVGHWFLPYTDIPYRILNIF
jgi:hypothetical protein